MVNRRILPYPVILLEKVVKFVVANGLAADIMALMSRNCIIMPPAIFLISLVLKAASSLSGLLLRRLAQ